MALAGAESGRHAGNRRRRGGVSLTELLCVLAILAVLVGMYASAVVRAYLRVMTFLQGVQ
ncbi:MAG: type II secretion system protein [Planctomycetaceae bacterium]